MNHPDPRIRSILERLAHPGLAVIDLSLSRMEGLMESLGHPARLLPSVVHVAGTNGKGSLLAYLTAIAQAAGQRVHRYTSPHLMRFNERIMLNGKDISDEALLPLLERIESHTQRHPVTFFEATTAAAFVAFAETPADLVLLETGLGGRLDATNLVPAPRLTAITPIAIDHTEFLGTTLESIAAEKAGILKPGVSCVVGPQTKQALRVIERVAAERGAPLFVQGRDWDASVEGGRLCYRSAQGERSFPLPSLVGSHQPMNAATAIACAEAMKEFNYTTSQLSAGIASAVWPARLQRLVTGRLADLLNKNNELWLDGGHNPHAGRMLAEWVGQGPGNVHLICAMLANKDIEGFLAPLAGRVASLTAIPMQEEPNAANPNEILTIARALSIRASLAANVKSAIEVIENNNTDTHRILICGSLYLAGDILWQNSAV